MLSSSSIYQFSFSPESPLTVYVNLAYVDGGHPYKDKAMDIVATPNCVVSIKVSGRVDKLETEYWQMIDEQFELVREVIERQYGIVKFSSSGSRIRWSVVTDTSFWLFAIGICSFIMSYVYGIKFSIQPSSLTKKYSIFIMIVAIFIVIDAVVKYEWFGQIHSNTYGYENLVHFILMFVVHLCAYLTNKPKVVSFAIWFIVLSLIANMIFWFSGWTVVERSHWVGMFFGSVLVTYTLVKSSSLKKIKG